MTNALTLAPDLTMPPESVTETFAILANRGAGKSSTAHRFVEQMHHVGMPVVVIDVKGDWWGIRSSASGKSDGLPFVIFGGDHADVPLEPTAGELVADLVVADRLSVVLDLSHMSKTKARSFATAFAERLYRRNRDALHVVIEEADVLVPQRAMGSDARLIGAMEDIAKRGRNRGLGLTVVTQRPQEVAKSVLDLMETVILLRMTGPRSIKAARDWISVNADDDDAKSQRVIGSLPTLKVGEGWVWSPAFLQILQRVQFAKFDTFDSHATPKPGVSRIIPKRRADIDLERLGADITATVERAKENDPAALRRRIVELERQQSAAKPDKALAAKDDEIALLRSQVDDLHRLVDEHAAATTVPDGVVDGLGVALSHLTGVAQDIEAVLALLSEKQPPRAAKAPRAVSRPTPPRVNVEEAPTAPRQFRAGAQRMITSLARMAPLRLTVAQWATVSKMKHTGGTWSTYLGEIRRAGLLDENATGITLSDAGFDYVGGRPEPMTGEELQAHYLSILRKGAARMLQVVMDAHPGGVTRDELADRSEVSSAGGTFSTYLGELRRNGLVEQSGSLLVATDVLMKGAQA